MSEARNPTRPEAAFQPVTCARGTGLLFRCPALAVWLLIFAGLLPSPHGMTAQPPGRKTALSIVGDAFHINGRPTYEGRTWRGHKIEGLLMNSRMVQGIFDDLNPETVARWAYPDTGQWDPDRNTREFIEAMADWRRHGLLCAVVNLQGGSPEGYSRAQPWHNSALRPDGSLRPEYMARLERILDRADELGMAIMLGVFYFGQDQRLDDDEAVKRAVVHTVDWIAERRYTNVLLEIANECDNSGYVRDIIKAQRVHELIELAQQRAARHHHPLPVSVSYNGGSVPRPNVVRTADYLLLHGNGVRDPRRMVEMILAVRGMPEYTGQPIVNNEDDRPWRDDHQGWGHEGNNLVACVTNYVSWGYFDFREPGEPFDQGFQSVPVNWQISSDRKRAFFELVAEITGGWTRLFDGQTLSGWHIKCLEADRSKTFWTVADGAILCDSMDSTEHDYVWLLTDGEYDDFELRLKVRSYADSPGNSGVQIRSRYADHAQWLDGPQVDLHPPAGWRSGLIYDETRGHQRWISPSLENWRIEPAQGPQQWSWNRDGWNDVYIRCQGTKILTRINGEVIADFEGAGVLDDDAHKELNVGMTGHIALQLHKHDRLRIAFKDILIRPLAP
jgi:hypothetical protein